MNEAPKDLRPEGSVLLAATYIAEVARAQHIAVQGFANGAIPEHALKLIRTKYFPFPAYIIEPKESPDGNENAASRNHEMLI